MSRESIVENLKQAQEILSAFAYKQSNISAIEKAAEIMVNALRKGNKIISCGNGGSMCDAMHFAEELSGRFRNDRAAIAAIAISDPSHLSCVANDFGYDFVFSRYIEGVGQNGDVLLAISTSGNSKNVLKAADTARSKGMKIVALSGKDGGQLAELCDAEIRAPESMYADRAQEIHIKVIHCLIDYIETQLRSAK